MCIIRSFGVFLIMAGVWWILNILAYATMIDPSLPDAAWWAEYRSKVLGFEGIGILATWASMIAVGVGLLVWSPDRSWKKANANRHHRSLNPEDRWDNR